jgi:hypothetical protein
MHGSHAMSRVIQKTTASGDAISLGASHRSAVPGRSVAQLEHNGMQALSLVRATLNALVALTRYSDRITLLLTHSRGLVDVTIKPELKRVFGEIADHVNTAALHGEPLLCGGASAYALGDPWHETSEPFCIELPDLRHAAQALTSIDLLGGTNALALGKRNEELLGELRHTQKQLTLAAHRLSEVLANARRERNASEPPPPRRNQDEGFVSLIGRVRDQVLHAGGAALRVQGAPSTRAAWLVEGPEDAH